jgi:ankyrin repeat protein
MSSPLLRAASRGFSIFLLAALAACSQFSAPTVNSDRPTADPIDAAADAAFKGDLAYVKACVESDPRYVEVTDGLGKTLLHYAAEGGHKEVVAYLLENGASTEVQDNDYKTPIELAGQAEAPKEVIDLLNQGPAQPAG